MTHSQIARAVCVLLLGSVAGCATRLSVHEISGLSRPESPPKELNHPRGIVVNKRARYTVTAVAADPQGDLKNANAFTVNKLPSFAGVDHDRVLDVDIVRYPFGSGTLSLVLNGNQTVKTLAITSESGAARAVTATTVPLQTREEIRKAREDK